MTTRFTDGTPGSESQVAQAFTELRTQGQAAINQLVVMRENTLLLFNNALTSLNGKRVRTNRLAQIGVPGQFVTSDLQDINQPITTASLRCDSNGVSLRERAAPGEAIVNTVRFSASEGTIQALQVPQTGASGNLGALYRVATADGSTPTGTFDIQLLDAVSISLLIFDMMDTPSSATVQAFTSQNGINFIPSQSITRNGYRLAAWFQPMEGSYLRIVVTPALPDILGGSVFTFGLTDLHAFDVQYHLRSDVYTNQIEIEPRSANLLFQTNTVPGLNYFLSLAGNPPVELFPGSTIPVPGASVVTQTGVALTAPTGHPAWASAHSYMLGDQIIDSNGNLQTVTVAGTSGGAHPIWNIVGGITIDNASVHWKETASSLLIYTLPGDAYLSTLTITDHVSGVEVRLAPGLTPLAIGLTNQYFTIDSSGNIFLILYNHAVDQTRTFDVSFTQGPDIITAMLQVELTTSDLNTTPIYNGAALLDN